MIPMVDVIIPNYNYYGFLRECLASLAQQGELSIRVLIIDDGSPNVPPTPFSQVSANRITICYLRHRVNRGHIYTYNQGLALVEAKYYMLLSPDDCLMPSMLTTLLAALEKYPEASFAFTPAYTGETPDSPKGVLGIEGFERLPRDTESLIPGNKFREILASLWFNPIPTPSVLVRTEAQRRVGGYRYSHPSSGDLEMWLRLSEVGPVVYVPSPGAFYRHHHNSMQHGYRLIKYRESLHMARVYMGLNIKKGIVTLARELAWTTALYRTIAVSPTMRNFLSVGGQPTWKRFLRCALRWIVNAVQRGWT